MSRFKSCQQNWGMERNGVDNQYLTTRYFFESMIFFKISGNESLLLKMRLSFLPRSQTVG